LRRLKSDETSEERSVRDQKAIEERLARLKGMDPKHYSMPPITVFQPIRHKTDTQKADDLLSQFAEEPKIDDSYRHPLPIDTRRLSTDQDIERRLARLKGDEGSDERPKGTSVMDIDTDLDDEEIEKRLFERLLAESKLPAIPTLPLDPQVLEVCEESVGMGSDCLPWCQICNEDAVIKCIDCCGDLYCKECFLDFHDDSDLKKHRTEPFRAPVSQHSF